MFLLSVFRLIPTGKVFFIETASNEIPYEIEAFTNP